jgi:hypothetical protein
MPAMLAPARVMMRALAESPSPAGEDATKPAAVVKYGLA